MGMGIYFFDGGFAVGLSGTRLPGNYRVLGIFVTYPYYLKSPSKTIRGHIAPEPWRHLIIACID
jgi:hypothetical protein